MAAVHWRYGGRVLVVELDLIHLHTESRSQRPIAELKAKHMCERLPADDNVIVAEMHEYRANVIPVSYTHLYLSCNSFPISDN